jgi:hypothetical protein
MAHLIFPPVALMPDSGSWSPHYRGYTITLTGHNIRQDSSGRMISPSLKPLPYNTQEEHIHAPDGIRTRSPSKRAAAELRL